MNNKEGFYKSISLYLKKGTIRPVFVSEKLSVLSVADSFYIASDYTKNKDGYVAFLVNSKMVRAMMLDEDFLEHLMLTTAPGDLKQMMFRLTDQTFRMFTKNGKQDGTDTLTHKFVDQELEQWIVDTYGPPPVFTTGDSPRRNLMDSFRSLFRKENRL